MSNTQTQIKGTVVLNSDTGANLTIGNATATNAITGTTNINTSGTSNTTIGNSVTIGNIVGGSIILQSPTITIGSTASNIALGALTGAGVLTLNKSLSPAYSYPITTNTLIGHIERPTITWSASNFGSIATSSSLPIGIYTIALCITLNGTFVDNTIYVTSSVTSNELESYRIPFVKVNTVSPSVVIVWSICQGSFTFFNDVIRTISLHTFAGTPQTLNGGNGQIMSITRIG